jgi:hypothetical protein
MLTVMLTLPKFHLNLSLVYLMLSVGLGGFWTIVVLATKINPINPPLRIVCYLIGIAYLETIVEGIWI